MEVKRRAKYELIDGQLQKLASSCYAITRDTYFKQARVFDKAIKLI